MCSVCFEKVFVREGYCAAFHISNALRREEKEGCPRFRGELNVGRLAEEGPLPNNEVELQHKRSQRLRYYVARC